MISNKNQFKNALKTNKDNIKIKRIYNFDKDNKIPEGSIADIIKVQSNAIVVDYKNINKQPWIYFDNVEIKDNKMIYYQYITEDKEEIAFENAKRLGIDIIKLDSKEYEKMNKNNNYNYKYKYIYMINEIIEVQ